jgi:hypothetical protein|uniref:Uncharacterized protein n=1 Tax=viral metagenome TaxID=1070528 RepID=A0A6C0LXQ8_9ZZZZ
MNGIIKTSNIYGKWVFWRVFCKMGVQAMKLNPRDRKTVLNGMKASLFKSDKK